jgi:hypothetical protein
VKVLQRRLGHKTAQETLDTYGHLWPDSDGRTREPVDGELFRHDAAQTATTRHTPGIPRPGRGLERGSNGKTAVQGLYAPLARRTRGDETPAVPSWRARILIGAVSP